MIRLVALVLALVAPVLVSVLPMPARAQDATTWVQVEAQPTLAEAEDRARAYAAMFPETSGFRLRSGWYAIMLGPYPEAEAAYQLDRLRREGMIPADSFLAFTRDFGDRYWPPAGTDAVLPDPVTAPDPLPPAAIPDETRGQARDSEALLTADDRRALQTALQWFGFYQGGIDGAFGPGTRASMTAWQEARGMLEPTGILTSRQRAELLAAWQDEIAAFGFAEVVEAEAGITVTLPLGLVEFDHYEPPFVHFRAKDGSGLQIVLISQPGDQAALTGLYDVLQSLEAVPLAGDRQLGDRSFRIRGSNDRFDTTAFAETKGGLIKGWMLISPPGQADRNARLIQTIEASFASDTTRALDPGMVEMSADTRAGLIAGLEVRSPRFSRSGFYIDESGRVVTTAEAVANCGRITLDRTVEARVTLSDAGLGLALLTPAVPLAPSVFARLQLAPERPGTEVMLAGYPYEDRLPAPALTFGTLAEVTGLNGEADLKRLALQALPGDAGGPVLDPTGAVIGMLLPAGARDGRSLPEGVQFAAASAAIARVLAAEGSPPSEASPAAALPPADLGAMGSAMTVLVSCWD